MTFLSYQNIASVVGLKHVNDIRVERSIAIDESRISTASGNGTCIYRS